MRFLVVSPNQLIAPDPVPPIGAAYAAAVARAAGHEVALYDACFAGERLHAELAEKLAAFRPDAVGLSLRNVDEAPYPHPRSALAHYQAVARTIRGAAPEAALILGGSAFTLFPRELMAALDADHGVVGEAELALPRLLESLARKQAVRGALERSESPRVPDAELARHVPPARDLLDVARYSREGGSVNLQTKRGCVFSCAYCTYPALEGGRVRARPPVEVVDEIESVVREHGVRSFFFVDSVFNVPPEHARAICVELERRRLDVRWTAYLTPAAIGPELVDAMRRAGCRSVDLGTDAASPATLAGHGKSFDVAQIQRASRLLSEAGIAFCHSLIFGGPGETWATFDETVATIEATQPTAIVAMVGVRLYPGTAIAARARASGLDTGSIGLEPAYWVEPAVADGLLERLAALPSRSPAWVVPGVTAETPAPLRRRLRARGAQGPLWEQLTRGPARDGAPR